jgi:hypothetical protein
VSQRIQRQRVKGWRMPENAVYVGRPSLWGNPWTPREAPEWIIPGWDGTGLPAAGSGRQRTPRERLEWAVAKYREELEHLGLLSDYSIVVTERRHDAVSEHIRESGATNMREYAPVVLRGHDLACFCPLDQPCHADVLLELAASSPPSLVPGVA